MELKELGCEIPLVFCPLRKYEATIGTRNLRRERSRCGEDEDQRDCTQDCQLLHEFLPGSLDFLFATAAARNTAQPSAPSYARPLANRTLIALLYYKPCCRFVGRIVRPKLDARSRSTLGGDASINNDGGENGDGGGCSGGGAARPSASSDRGAGGDATGSFKRRKPDFVKRRDRWTRQRAKSASQFGSAAREAVEAAAAAASSYSGSARDLLTAPLLERETSAKRDNSSMK
eukprot:580958-Pleurochrysis_carterae.AAC.1